MQNGLKAQDGTVMPEIGGRWGLIAWDHQDNGDRALHWEWGLEPGSVI